MSPDLSFCCCDDDDKPPDIEPPPYRPPGHGVDGDVYFFASAQFSFGTVNGEHSLLWNDLGYNFAGTTQRTFRGFLNSVSTLVPGLGFGPIYTDSGDRYLQRGFKTYRHSFPVIPPVDNPANQCIQDYYIVNFDREYNIMLSQFTGRPVARDTTRRKFNPDGSQEDVDVSQGMTGFPGITYPIAKIWSLGETFPRGVLPPGKVVGFTCFPFAYATEPTLLDSYTFLDAPLVANGSIVGGFAEHDVDFENKTLFRQWNEYSRAARIGDVWSLTIQREPEPGNFVTVTFSDVGTPVDTASGFVVIKKTDGSTASNFAQNTPYYMAYHFTQNAVGERRAGNRADTAMGNTMPIRGQSFRSVFRNRSIYTPTGAVIKEPKVILVEDFYKVYTVNIGAAAGAVVLAQAGSSFLPDYTVTIVLDDVPHPTATPGYPWSQVEVTLPWGGNNAVIRGNGTRFMQIVTPGTGYTSATVSIIVKWRKKHIWLAPVNRYIFRVWEIADGSAIRPGGGMPACATINRLVEFDGEPTSGYAEFGPPTEACWKDLVMVPMWRAASGGYQQDTTPPASLPGISDPPVPTMPQMVNDARTVTMRIDVTAGGGPVTAAVIGAINPGPLPKLTSTGISFSYNHPPPLTLGTAATLRVDFAASPSGGFVPSGVTIVNAGNFQTTSFESIIYSSAAYEVQNTGSSWQTVGQGDFYAKPRAGIQFKWVADEPNLKFEIRRINASVVGAGNPATFFNSADIVETGYTQNPARSPYPYGSPQLFVFDYTDDAPIVGETYYYWVTAWWKSNIRSTSGWLKAFVIQ